MNPNPSSPETLASRNGRPYELKDIKPTGYDTVAIESYAVFRELKAAGTIPKDVRFQVCLPTPLSVLWCFVEDDGTCRALEPIYETRLIDAFQKIQEEIPSDELTVQWDLPMAIVFLSTSVGDSMTSIGSHTTRFL